MNRHNNDSADAPGSIHPLSMLLPKLLCPGEPRKLLSGAHRQHRGTQSSAKLVMRRIGLWFPYHIPRSQIFFFDSIAGNSLCFWSSDLFSERFLSTENYFSLPFLDIALHFSILLSGDILHYQTKWSWSVLSCRVGMPQPCAAFGKCTTLCLHRFLGEARGQGCRCLLG